MIPVFTSSPEDDSRNSSPSPVSKLLDELTLNCNITEDTPDSVVLNGKAEDQSHFLSNGKETDEAQESLPSPPEISQSTPVKQKPPAISKKPKLSFLQQFSSQLINEQAPAPCEDTGSLSRTEDQVDALLRQTKEEEKEREQQEEGEISQISESLAESSEASTEIQDECRVSAPASQETSVDNGPCPNGEAQEEEDEEGDGTSSTSGSISSREDDSGVLKFLCFSTTFKVRNVEIL